MLLVTAKAALESVCLVTETVHHANCVSTFQSPIHIKNILSQMSSKPDLHVDLSKTLLMSASLMFRSPKLMFHELFSLIITNAQEICYFL